MTTAPAYEARVELGPGEGLLCRRGTAVLFLPERGADSDELVAAFRGAGLGGPLDALTTVAMDRELDVPPFVCVDWGQPSPTVMVFGPVELRTDHPSLPLLSGAGSETWVEHALRGARDAIELTVEPPDAHGGTDLRDGEVPASGFRIRLRQPTAAEVAPPGPTAPTAPSVQAASAPAADPVEPADDVRLSDPTALSGPTAEESGAAASGGTEPDPEPEAAPTAWGDTAVLDLADLAPPADPDDPDAALAAIQAAAVRPEAAPTELAPPRPEDEEVHEPHLDDHDVDEPDLEASVHVDHDADDDDTAPSPEGPPAAGPPGSDPGRRVEARLCDAGHANPPTAASCRECGALLTPGDDLAVVSAPSLGTLELDDGRRLELDRNYVLGRRPSDGSGEAVTVAGDKVSREHAEVALRGWDVHVADLGSTNGTFVVPRPGDEPIAVEPDVPLAIHPGAVVYVGSRFFTYLRQDAAAISLPTGEDEETDRT